MKIKISDSGLEDYRTLKKVPENHFMFNVVFLNN